MAGIAVNKNLPSTTLFLIIGSTLLIGLFFLSLILPKYLFIEKIEKQILDQQVQLEKQKSYFPLYVAADQLARFEFNPKLPIVQHTPVKRNDISALSQIFETMAVKHNLTLSGNALDTSQINSQSPVLSVQLSLKGSLSDFRNYLVKTGELPFFSSFEHIGIQPEKGSTRQFTTRIKIFVDQK